MSVAMGKLCFFASSAIASQTSGRLMNTLRPAAPCCLSRLTSACASSGVFAPATAYGMIVGAEILFSADSFACATIVSTPSMDPGSRMVVIPCASHSLYP